MRNFIRNSLAALGKNSPQLPPTAPPPPPSARPNRRQRRQQELGQRRNQVQVNRALEQALVASKKKKDTFTVTDAQGRQLETVLGIDKGIGHDRTVVVTGDGDQYTVVQHEPTECHPTPNDRD